MRLRQNYTKTIRLLALVFYEQIVNEAQPSWLSYKFTVVSLHKKEKNVTRRKELFYYVTSGSNVTPDVHWYVIVFYIMVTVQFGL